MGINGQVYDFTAYLPGHPADPAVIQPWCVRDASEAYRTKTRGRPHSPYADTLLPKYRIGALTAKVGRAQPPGFTLKMSVGRVPRCAWAAAWSEPSGDTATRRPPTRAAIARLRQAVNCGYQDD